MSHFHMPVDKLYIVINQSSIIEPLAAKVDTPSVCLKTETVWSFLPVSNEPNVCPGGINCRLLQYLKYKCWRMMHISCWKTVCVRVRVCVWFSSLFVRQCSHCLAHTYQSLKFLLPFSLFFHLSFICMQPLTQTFKAGKYKDRHIHHRFKQDLLELQLALYWSVCNLDLSLKQSAVAVEGCHVWQEERWESCRSQKKGRERWRYKNGVQRKEHGKFLHQNDRVAKWVG